MHNKSQGKQEKDVWKLYFNLKACECYKPSVRQRSVTKDADSAPAWSLPVFKGKPHHYSPLWLIELFLSSTHILSNVLSLTLFMSTGI